MITLGITLGDVTGIGPEVAFKALAQILPEDDTRYVLIGDPFVIHQYLGCFGVDQVLARFGDPDATTDRLSWHDIHEQPLPAALEAGAPEAARAALGWLREGVRLCLDGSIDGLVTAPVNKESIIDAGFSTFTGQTGFVADLAQARRTAMMLLGCDDRNRWLRVVLATQHVPIRHVADHLTLESIEIAIERADDACRLLELARRRIAVCGLNPHAGEGGKIGREEMDIIEPAVNRARSRGIDVEGPYAADALFHRVFRGDYDAVVAMYHDQGLVPLKMIGFETGVNWTLGLPFVRTSPDHGTAHDIAGRGIAEPSSMMAAIRLARAIAPRMTAYRRLIHS